jgi:hypothetical protein
VKVDPTLVKESNEAHDLFLNSWTGIKFNQREFGHACEWIETRGLHRFQRAPGTKAGFFSFDSYVNHHTGGECSRSFIMECKRIYRLTQGEDAIPPEVVDQLPKKNALQIARVKKHAPGKVTKALIEKARREPVMKFAVTAQGAINETLPEAQQKSPMEYFHGLWHPEAVAMLKETMEDFKILVGVVLDKNLALDIESKAIMSICTSARSFAGDSIKAAKEKLRREAPILPETEPETHTTDAATAIANATTEGRVVRAKSDARN